MKYKLQKRSKHNMLPVVPIMYTPRHTHTHTLLKLKLCGNWLPSLFEVVIKIIILAEPVYVI